MAIANNRTTTTTNTTPRRMASVDPDAMVSTGLANNFHGVPTIRYTIRKYEKGKKAGCWYLAARVDIATDDPDVGGGKVTEYYRVGDLKEWVPSADGETPLEISFEDYLELHLGSSDVDDTTLAAINGTYLAPTPKGSQANVPNNTKWAQLVRAVRDCGFPKERMGATCDFLDGVGCDWSRLPYVSPGGGSMTLEEGQRAPETLCVVGIDMDTLPALGGGKKAATTTTSKAATTTATTATKLASSTATTADDLDARVDQAIVDAITAAGGELHKSKLGSPVVKALGKDGAKSVKLLSDNAWLAAGIDREAGYVFDADSGTLTSIG